MGANTLLLNMNVGAMPHDVFLEQIRRFGREVLPKLQAHQVKRVPAAETVAALQGHPGLARRRSCRRNAPSAGSAQYAAEETPSRLISTEPR